MQAVSDYATVPVMEDSPSSRALRRLREEMEKKKLSQQDVADLLQWTPSRLSKVLNGVVELSVNDLAALCFACGLSVVEAVRDHGLEFIAEMTPTELRILERFRELSPNVREAMLTVLAVPATTRHTARRAIPYKNKKNRVSNG